MSFLGGLAGGAVGGAVVNLYLDDKQFKAGLTTAEAQTKGASNSMVGSFSKFKAVGMAALSGIAVAAVAFGTKAVQAASDQEEALNKVKVVFGDTSAQVEQFASTAAESLGMSETAALSAAGTFGNFLTAAGLATDQIADMSTEIVTLAADLASFNNIDPTEALEKLRSGLAGEAEPLRSVGVFLDEARVASEAYSSGIAQVGDDLTAAQKIQARYNIILEDTTLAQGDFSRTSDSLANQQRILAAQFEDLTAKVGRALLPVISALAGVLLAMLNNLPALTKAVVAFGGAWVAINLNTVVASLGSIAIFIKALPAQIGSTIAAMSGLRLATLGTVAAIGAVGVGGIKYQEINDQLQMLKERGIQADGAINLLSQDFEVNADAVRLAYEENLSYEDALKKVEAGAAGAEAQTAALTAKVKASEKAAKEAAKAYRDNLVSAFDVSGESVFGFKAKVEGTVTSFLRGLANMRKRAEDTAKDLREFNKLDIGKGIRDFLLQQGPDAISVFVDANKAGRKEAVDQIGGIVDAEKILHGHLDTATNKALGLTGAMDKLGRKKADPTVTFHYRMTDEDGALKSFLGLMGQQGAGTP